MNFDTFYIKRFLLCIVLLAFTFKNSYLKTSEIEKKKKNPYKIFKQNYYIASFEKFYIILLKFLKRRIEII